jgi:hypothetical protein
LPSGVSGTCGESRGEEFAARSRKVLDMQLVYAYLERRRLRRMLLLLAASTQR